MPGVPRDPLPESSAALLIQGYEYAAKRFARFRSDVFEARLLLQRTTLINGREAAELFYDGKRFKRAGAMPEPMLATLFGRGGVHGLDGDAQHHRKALFMSFLTEAGAEAQRVHMQRELRAALPRWQRKRRVVLFDEAEEVICRAVCAWAGVPLQESEVEQRTRDLSATVVHAASPALNHLRARRARGRSERWAEDLVQRARDGRIEVPAESPLAIVARHTDLDGAPLPLEVAAVDLLNVIRPSIAVAHFVAFIGLALLSFPEERRKLEAGEVRPRWFAEEVRRFYPFVPVMPAKVREPFDWRGAHFPAGRRVLLHIHGLLHDPREWDDPHEFRPARFAGEIDDVYTFIPQGGGDAATGHRCPGELNTLAIMEAALDFLLHEVEYDVPPQDLRVSRAKFPARPNSGLLIANVRPRSAAAGDLEGERRAI